MSGVADFLDGLRRQRDKYREMVAVVEDQKKVLAGSDLDALLGLVERKRALMADIEELEKRLLPVKERWAEVRAGADPAVLREVEETVVDIRGVLGTLVKLEDEGRALMQRRQESAAGDLQALMQRRGAGRAYGDPRRHDRKN